ncbi:MAG: 50S ribosomal protein L24 [Candidatus Diapherotrites archaeon CG11_big_fil_rev_8_21_14_0_20_37_9]|nr:MAG: 50S ribosomal protein L24 [Candidatus Diapherotrites archaeon CG11_big_fil_rev_8_21_14_0_20_37_9]
MESTSSKPKKQRKSHYTKALHKVQAQFGGHLSRELRKQTGKRSLTIRKGDTVKVMRGGKDFVGKSGKVTAVRRAKLQVLVEGIIRKRTDGTERQIPFRPSNLMITAIEEKDSRRLEKNITTKVKKDGK